MEGGTHARAGLLAGLVTPEGIHSGAVYEELQPVSSTGIEEVHGGLFLVRGTPCWSRGRV